MPPSKIPSVAATLSSIDKLSKEHELGYFDCGKESLNTFLKQVALRSAQKDATQTYVVHRAGVVVAYYTLTPGSIARDEAPDSVRKGLPRDLPIGVILIARFAVDKREQGRGLGSALMKDALLRIEQAADIIGARAVLVHALGCDARRFYEERFDFERCPVNEHHLMLRLADLRATLRDAGLRPLT